jgi:hypothetical protein
VKGVVTESLETGDSPLPAAKYYTETETESRHIYCITVRLLCAAARLSGHPCISGKKQ